MVEGKEGPQIPWEGGSGGGGRDHWLPGNQGVFVVSLQNGDVRMSPDGLLPEMIEYEDHPWFIGVQFHPELKSRPFAPHPLFASFVGAAVEQSRLV